MAAIMPQRPGKRALCDDAMSPLTACGLTPKRRRFLFGSEELALVAQPSGSASGGAGLSPGA